MNKPEPIILNKARVSSGEDQTIENRVHIMEQNGTFNLVIPKAYEDLLFFLHDRDNPPYRYYDYSGGRSSAKSTSVAIALALEASMYPTRILCTREFQNSIQESVKQLLADIISHYQLPGFTITREQITHVNGSVFWFKGLHEDPESTLKGIEGVDRCWIEEAQFITDHSLDVLLPTIRKNGSTIIFTRNPLTPEDAITTRFVTHPSQLTQQRTTHHHTTWRDAEQAGILPEEILRQVEESRNNPDFAHIWEGMPYEKTINQIISWQQLADATERQPQTDGGVSFGVDVARYGADRTAVAIVKGRHLVDLVSWNKTSLVETSERIITLAGTYHPSIINVDDTGVGGGVTDILRSRSQPVNGVNFGAKPKHPDRYPAVSSELWFEFAEQLPEITINPNLEHRAELFQELSTREWTINNRNLREVQRKKDYKTENQTGSPDLADSILLAYYKPLQLPSWDVAVC